MPDEPTKTVTKLPMPEFTRSVEGLQNLRPAGGAPATGGNEGQSGGGGAQSGTSQDKK